MSQIFHQNQFKFFEISKQFKELFLQYELHMIGGTALALQIEHRTSVDFDFATSKDLDIDKLIRFLNEHLGKFEVTQLETNTLTIDWQTVKISFFGGIKLQLLEKFVEYGHFKLLSIRDIAAMKLRTILSRSTLKDYFDLAYILKYQNVTVKDVLDDFYKKYGAAGTNYSEEILLKTLTFTKDITDREIELIKNKDYWGNTPDEIITAVANTINTVVADYLKTNSI